MTKLEQSKNMKKQIVSITINRGQGLKETFELPLVNETTSGFICSNSEYGLPASEWFPRKSEMIQSHLIQQ